MICVTFSPVIDVYKRQSMSYMEDHVLAYKAPLYGRRTAQFKIQPFDFFEACQHFGGFSDFDKALAYGVIGGTPQYLLQIDDRCSMEENIKNTHLNPSSSCLLYTSKKHQAFIRLVHLIPVVSPARKLWISIWIS